MFHVYKYFYNFVRKPKIPEKKDTKKTYYELK